MVKRRFRSDALQEMYEEIVGDNLEREAIFEQELAEAELLSTGEPCCSE
jgi:hypothetical protein